MIGIFQKNFHLHLLFDLIICRQIRLIGIMFMHVTEHLVLLIGLIGMVVREALSYDSDYWIVLI